jgi:uncharacterized protein YaeQ
MALKATIFKAQVQVSDMERGYYADHALTLARHPSETDERMMLRITAFALNADPALEFGKGLSDEDEPGLWQKSLTGTIEQWIEVGLPEAKRLRKACGRARDVCVYAYGRGAGIWWRQAGEDLARHENLVVWTIPVEASQALAALTSRNMKLQFTIQDGVIFVSDEKRSIQIEPQLLKRRG